MELDSTQETTKSAGPPNTLLYNALRHLLKKRSAVTGLVMLGTLILIAIFAPVIATYDPAQILDDAKRNTPPCIHLLGCPADQTQHYFGIDGNSRDFFSRVVFGSRLSLQIGFVCVTFAIVVGTLLGMVSGYVGGWLDNGIMRVMDVLLAFPSLLLAIAIVAVLGPGLINTLLAISIVSIPQYARIVRVSVLSIKGTGLCDRLARARRISRPYPIPPHPAQCPDPSHRSRNTWHCDSHPGCCGALIPRSGGAAADPRVGIDAGRRA